MAQRLAVALTDLYLEDETAWLETMADLIGAGAVADLDFDHLREYLLDMARRDCREVESRLVVLLMHLLKWEHQPGQRSRGWHATIAEQQQELRRLAGRGVLRDHAQANLTDLHPDAVARAAAETGLEPDAFPAVCAFTFESALGFVPRMD